MKKTFKRKEECKHTPDFLCVGFFCHDLHRENYILGGTASYSSLVASKMMDGQVAVLTSVGEDFLFEERFEKAGIEVCNKTASKTTVFENIYENGHRTQYLHERSEVLLASDLPEAWKLTPVVKFCLIADEVDASLMDAFPNALIAATIQGWLRQWDDKGKISPKEMNWDVLKKVDIVLMSEADVLGMETVLDKIIELVDLVLVTRGDKGASVYYQKEEFIVPVYPVEEIDPTGAGDIFAVSFLAKYRATKDIILATTFAHVVASFVVEGVGVHLPTKAAIAERWAAYKDLFPQFFKKN